MYRLHAEIGTLAAVSADRGGPVVTHTSDLDERILECVAWDRVSAGENWWAVVPVDHVTVWWLLHEQLLYS